MSLTRYIVEIEIRSCVPLVLVFFYFYYYKTDFLIDKLTSAGFEILSSFQINYELSNTGSELHTVLISKK